MARHLSQIAILQVVSVDTPKNIRNIVILLVLAAMVWLLPGAGLGSQAAYTALITLFVVGMLFFGYRMYLEHRETFYSLGKKTRVLLYGCVALATLVLVGTPRLWSSGIGSALWVLLLGLAGWGFYVVFRAYRRY